MPFWLCVSNTELTSLIAPQTTTSKAGKWNLSAPELAGLLGWVASPAVLCRVWFDGFRGLDNCLLTDPSARQPVIGFWLSFSFTLPCWTFRTNHLKEPVEKSEFICGCVHFCVCVREKFFCCRFYHNPLSSFPQGFKVKDPVWWNLSLNSQVSYEAPLTILVQFLS